MASNTIESQFVVDGTGTLVGYPPVLGLPSSATVFLSTPSFPRPAVATAAAVASSTSSIGTAHSRGATALTLDASVSVVKDRLYVVAKTNGTGARFTVRAAQTATTTVIQLADPLPCDITASEGAVFSAFAVTVAITTAMTDQIGRGSAEWTATVDGVVYTWAQDIRIVERLTAPKLTASDVVRLSPYAAKLQPPDDAVFDEIIDFAWQYGVVPQLIAKGLRPERIVSWEAINPWHLAEIEKRLADLYETDAVVVDRKTAAALTSATLAFSGSQFWYDAGDDLAVPDEDDVQPWSITFVNR